MGVSPDMGDGVSLGDQPTRTKGLAAPKRGSRGITVAVGLVLALGTAAVAFYYPSLRGWVGMRAWSSSGPKACLVAFSEAIAANDAAAIGACSSGVDVETDPSSGALTRLKASSPQGMGAFQWMTPPQVAPALPLRDLNIRWDYEKSAALCYVAAEDGGRLRYELRRDAKTGRWRVACFMLAGAEENW